MHAWRKRERAPRLRRSIDNRVALLQKSCSLGDTFVSVWRLFLQMEQTALSTDVSAQQAGERFQQELITRITQRLEAAGITLERLELPYGSFIQTAMVPAIGYVLPGDPLRGARMVNESQRNMLAAEIYLEMIGDPRGESIIENILENTVESVVFSVKKDNAELPAGHPMKNKWYNLYVRYAYEALRQSITFHISFYTGRLPTEQETHERLSDLSIKAC